ncbi:hypothetical protein Taro_038642, partial [Colocasia esculenta]|nr:hypothetical protein [Colocasia esculenta]
LHACKQTSSQAYIKGTGRTHPCSHPCSLYLRLVKGESCGGRGRMLKMVFCRNAYSFTTLVLVLIFSMTWGTVKGERSGGFIRSEEEVKWLFEEWQVKHDKSYQDLGEKQKRLEIFKNNLQYIDEKNRPEHNHSFTVGLNNLADLTNEEYQSFYLSPPMNMSELSRNFIPDLDLPSEADQVVHEYRVDWREDGAVTPVKDQGRCKLGWDFAAVATVEAINALVTGDLISLSVQEIVDCGGYGCRPTVMTVAYDYIERNKGIDTDANYPYTAEKGSCREKKNQVVTIDGHAYGRRNDEMALANLVALHPVASAVDANTTDFQLYTGGIFTGKCKFEQQNQPVAIVGYGEDYKAHEDYWIIKNSYGQGWGEGGYMKLQRNVQSHLGKCGIALLPIYPTKSGYNIFSTNEGKKYML